jgi:hypothetical protein
MIKYTKNEVNQILSFVSEFIDDEDFRSPSSNIITEKDLRSYYSTGVKKHLIEPLIGYSVESEVDGDHRHDGQVVDYTFIFTSPTGEVTKLFTSMCLMIGWNYYQDFKIA